MSARLKIVVYSDDSTVRAAISAALGRRIAPDLSEHDVVEFATAPALRQYVDQPSVEGALRADLFILDGEAVPEGGMGVCRQLKDEVFNCPPVMVIIGRKADGWLAAWSRAEATIMHPIDPFTLAHEAAALLRSRTQALA